MFSNTLIEMLIVMMIISILLLVAVPNMTKNTSVANDKGCEATIDLLQAQVGAYLLEHGEEPKNITDLKDYVTTTSCPDGTSLKIDGNGKVVIDAE
ncbi:competence type IV pilus major pilin ComGC [Alkalihalobacterium alkalinitrilicum]|uniref:competence type IV pilus major pilin ComGC n=1 Tax=Alkalihalobacterium alkalinitrilicum TaxID=427920 RepID=UPI0009952C02|nr:competence type IV pilus major pilin ComGC [Alkalihalobacterium alkalinitrilicum]